MYFSKIKKNEGKASKNGNDLRITYGIKIDKETGHKVVYEKGKTNLYEKIQASAESVKIENIIKRAQLGDTEVLNHSAIYADVTIMPKTLAEAQSVLLKVEEEFNKLPAEMKARYNFSVNEFIAKFADDYKAAEKIKLEQLAKEEAIYAESAKQTTEIKEKI